MLLIHTPDGGMGKRKDGLPERWEQTCGQVEPETKTLTLPGTKIFSPVPMLLKFFGSSFMQLSTSVMRVLTELGSQDYQKNSKLLAKPNFDFCEPFITGIL